MIVKLRAKGKLKYIAYNPEWKLSRQLFHERLLPIIAMGQAYTCSLVLSLRSLHNNGQLLGHLIFLFVKAGFNGIFLHVFISLERQKELSHSVLYNGIS